MKQTCLAIADLFIPAEMMAEGLQALEEAGIDVTVKQWHHNSLEELQQANLAIEQGGVRPYFCQMTYLKALNTMTSSLHSSRRSIVMWLKPLQKRR
ncbi:hypothetical protein JCM19045_3237 [Bacillus sp. JCM 19045]|nr:hypothetical protein JCM19045_3237 [Bacillus sp. JCM 19045]